MANAKAGAVLYTHDGRQVFLTPGGGDQPAMDSVVVMLHAMAWLLRRAREYHGWAQADVAERCGVSVSVLCRAELARRVPRLWLVLRICNVLGVRFSDVMRAAENEAFPHGATPWTDEPTEVLYAPDDPRPLGDIGPERLRNGGLFDFG
jgi:transcriptional regulator with XRE-family HTH domain